MYTLRTIRNDGAEVNIFLGGNYTLFIKKKVYNEKFEKLIEDYFDGQPDFKEGAEIPEITGFIDAVNLSNPLPIYSNEKNYIVNENGKTFCKL